MRVTDTFDLQKSLATFGRILAHSVAAGGGTWQRHTGAQVAPETGYTVGVGKVACILLDLNIGHSHVVDLANAWPTTAPANAQYVGTWVAHDCLFVDHVTVIPDLALAISLARKHSEEAIWDNAAGESIDVALYLAKKEAAKLGVNLFHYRPGKHGGPGTVIARWESRNEWVTWQVYPTSGLASGHYHHLFDNAWQDYRARSEHNGPGDFVR